MSSIAMEICPMCATCPRLTGRWRVQVRCSCGACGPRMKTEAAAIARWNSVASFLRELGRTESADASGISGHRAGARRLVRRLSWQCGLEPLGGL